MTSTLSRTASHHVGLVTTYPPTRCGIARFSSSLLAAVARNAPDIDVDVIRLVNGGERSAIGRVAMEVDPSSGVGIRAAARHLNRTDLVVIQHEYGIFGVRDGESVIDLAQSVHRPVVTILHTVVSNPSDNQRRIIESLSDLSTLVVLSRSARDVLAERYAILHDQVAVIPHGAQWPAHPPTQGSRTGLITWGLLGPGKGLERSIRAMALLRDIAPRPRYRIVGRTHPAVLRSHGHDYKRHLENLVEVMGVTDMVEFIDRYVQDDELERMVAGSDVVVVPYDNDEQVSSGVLTDAVGAGRPVVATRFPHAVELLRDGAGVVVPHDSESIAAGVRQLILEPGAYERAALAAAAGSRPLSWDASAHAYADLIRSLVRRQATA